MKNKVYVYGMHAINSLLEISPERIFAIYLLQGRQDKKMAAIIAAAKAHGITCHIKTKQELERIAQNEHHQGVIAECQPLKTFAEHDLKALLENCAQPFLLILDNIQDPHNLGACMRSANAAGVHAIIAPKDKSVGLTPTVYKVACGAADILPFVQVTNLARTLDMLKEMGIWIYGTAGEAEKTIYETNLQGPIAIAMGAEGEGLRRLTREKCDGLIKIPMFGQVSSLNVSVATGISLFEVVRQRLKGN